MSPATLSYSRYSDFSTPFVIERPPMDGVKKFRIKIMLQPVYDDDSDDDEFERLPREEVIAEMRKHKALFDRLAGRFPMHD